MVNEAIRCLGEGILRSARDGDVGAVFGLGFPPFRGGPFRWADTLGAKELLARMERLRARHGERFEPAPLLVEHAAYGTARSTSGSATRRRTGSNPVRPVHFPRKKSEASTFVLASPVFRDAANL